MKSIERDEEGNDAMIKESIEHVEIIKINVYTPNAKMLSYMKQILTDLKAKIESNTIIVGDFNKPLTEMGSADKTKFQQGSNRAHPDSRTTGDDILQMQSILIFINT